MDYGALFNAIGSARLDGSTYLGTSLGRITIPIHEARPGRTSSCDAKTTAATADDASPGPSITSWPRLADLERYYPPDADRQGIAGMVLIEVTLDRHGRPTEALVLGEEPLDMGFGAAASALAHVMVYSNPTGQAAQLKFKVKFAPGREHAAATQDTKILP